MAHLRYSGIECRCFEPNSNYGYFHPKLYIFKFQNDLYSIIIGSSNITKSGLDDNVEANIFLNNITQSDADQFITFFNTAFNNAEILNTIVLNKHKKARDDYIRHQNEFRKKLRNKSSKKLFPIAQERILTSDQITKIQRVIISEKQKYINWIQRKNECQERIDYLIKVNNYISNDNWINLFKELWSVNGLKRGPLARYRTNPGIPQYIVNNNIPTNISIWIGDIQNKDWGNAINNSPNWIGDGIQSELFCALHGESYGIKNDKSKKALEYLVGDSKSNFFYSTYADMSYPYFNLILKEIGQIYLESVGRECSTIPLLLELDAFFWYLSDENII